MRTLLFLALLCCGCRSASDQSPTIEFTLNDTAGRPVSLRDFASSRAVVVAFLGTECSLANAYAVRLKELHEEFSPAGVQFLVVNSSSQDSPAAVARHAREHAFPFPVLKDPGQKVADLLGATRTPEVFLLGTRRNIRYQGRIDDQLGVGTNRAAPARRDLAEAIAEVLAGRRVTVPTTPPIGCLIPRSRESSGDAVVTYSDVAPILRDRCVSCHRPGQIGPFSLLTFEQARDWSDMIREVVTEGRMPPWHADAPSGHFRNDRSLTAKERQTLLAWIDQGCAEGKAVKPSPAATVEGGWRIGKPDVVLTMAEAFPVPAKSPPGGIPYQRIRLKTNFGRDVWVRKAEVRPGAPAVVHHARALVGEAKRVGEGDNGADGQALASYVPGGEPMELRDGVARLIPAGAEIELEMHYTCNGTAQVDLSSLGLVLADGPPRHAAYTRYIANRTFAIPPGASDHVVRSRTRFDRSAVLLDLMPHMHLRGKSITIRASYPDGRTETLLSVPRYDFHWQTTYYLREPLLLPAGTVIECVAHFDNSAGNPNNPDPAREVRWGDQSWEEMMLARMTFYCPDEDANSRNRSRQSSAACLPRRYRALGTPCFAGLTYHCLKTWSPALQAYSVSSRMTRQGLPAANTPSWMSRVTTLPAPMTHREPILTPGQMIAPPPTHTSDPISTGLPNSCLRRSSALSGWVAV